MAVIIHHKVLRLAYSLLLASAIGSIIPDIDHIPMALGVYNYGGRIAHNTLFAFAIFCFGYAVASLSGLLVFRILDRIGEEVMYSGDRECK